MLSLRSTDSASPDALPPGGGAMGDRVRAFDWSRHPLGPPALWPHSLKLALRIVLTSRYSMWLGWGREFYFFCNDAYHPRLGAKEQWALGAPASKVWEEVWDHVGPRAESVMQTGQATWDESLPLFLERNGYAEETYHTFSYSAVPDDDGSVGGMLCVINEDTERVIGERRLALLRELATDLAGTTTVDGWRKALQDRLAARPLDVPFALVYLFENEAAEARLAAAHGTIPEDPAAPKVISCQSAVQAWPARAILEQSAPLVVDDVAARFAAWPANPWPKPPRQALVVPIAQQGSGGPAGFLVVGINPYRPLDAAYRGFVDLLAGQIASGLANVRAYEAERKRAESLVELDRAKTTFFSDVSHELRTPLTLTLAPMEDILMLPAEQVPAPVRELASVARRNGRRLLKLVNTIVDFAHVEEGRTQATFVPTDLAAFTAELASSFRAAIERAGLSFVVDCPPLPEPIHVDRDMWEKIVLNLLSNAFKFTSHGEIRVSLRRAGDSVEFSVKDTGTGIAPESRAHLFERFCRVRGTPCRTFEGTGLGLARVRDLVKLHGGTIHVESEPGAGSTFTVILRRGTAHLPPQAEATATSPGVSPEMFTAEAHDREKDSPTSEPARTVERSVVGGKVLVVDDNADMRRYITRLLSPRFEVLTAADGAAALELLHVQKPDLVVSDAMMPKLDGFTLLKAIRSRPELRTIPVILLSARVGEQSCVAGLDAGADDYLVKPFSARELLARVNVHLQMARIRGQAEERERELRTNAEMFARALRESTERLSASLVAAGTGTFRWDIRTSALDSDEALDRLLGLVPGRGVRSLGEFMQRVHGDDRSRVLAAFERCSRQGANFDLEFRVLLPDSSLRWLSVKAKTFFNEQHKPVYMTGACVDVTKRKQTEMFVWRQKDVLEQIVEGAPLGDVLETITLDVEQVTERPLIAVVMMADADGRRLRPVAGRRCPSEWKRTIDGIPIAPDSITCGVAAFTKERAIVRDVATSPQWEKYRREALKHGLRACWSTPIISLGGHVLGTFDIYYPEASTPTDEEARFVEIVVRTAAIVTERDRAQRALDESRAKLAEHAQNLERRVQERTAKLQETVSDLESFSYSISHDMRAPLRAMQSFAQILAEECAEQIGPEGKDYIRRIITASDRMDRLIQDVLTYSRVTRTELKLDPVDLEKLVGGILETYPQFHPPKARVDVQRPLPRVLGNEAALTQCFSNLIGNAIKFVAPGVEPRVQIWAEPRDTGRVRVFIRDNGIGIEKDAHEKIFRIFYQLDRSYTGTGIGLSIVRKAMERMGGGVGVDSEPGRGSTFYLEMNLAE